MLTPVLVLGLIFLIPGAVAYGATPSESRTPLSSALSHGIVAVFCFSGMFAAASRFVPLPFNVLTWLLGYLTTILLCVRWVKRCDTRASGPRVQQVLGLGLVAVAVIGHLIVWRVALSNGHVIPNHDAINHTMWVANMARFDSLDSPEAYFNSFTGFASGSALYPFSFHAVTAIPVQLAAGSASESVVAATLLLCAVLWPLGAFSVAQALGLKPHRGAGFAAVATVPVYAMPYNTLGWGGITMVAGVVLLAHCLATAIAWFPRSPRNFWTALAVCGLALLTTHTSEFFVLPAAVLILTCPQSNATGSTWKRSTLVVLTILCFVFPWIDRAWGSGDIARLADAAAPSGGAVYQIVGHIIMLTPGMETQSLWVLVFFIIGISRLRTVEHTSTLILWLYFALLMFIGGMLERSFFSTLSFALAPWYRQFQRMSYLVALGLVLLVAASIDSVALKLPIPKLRGARSRLIATNICFSAFSLIVVGTSVPNTARVADLLFGSYATMSESALAIPGHHPELLDKRSVVLASYDSGAAYWAANDGVNVLGAPFLSSEIIAEREALLDMIAVFATSEENRKRLQSMGITHVVTNSRAMSGSPRPTAEAIEASRDFELIDDSGGVRLWRVRDVVGGFAGSLAGPIDVSGLSALLMTERGVRIGVHNLSDGPRLVRVSFAAIQNSCKSVSSVTVEGSGVVSLVAPETQIEFDVELLPGESSRRQVRLNGGRCFVDGDQTGHYVAVTEPNMIILRGR